MVLQRTIENLRELPKQERQAVAFWIAILVVIVLALAWGIFFFRTVGSTSFQPVNEAYDQAVQQVKAQQGQTPTPPDDTGWVSSAPQTAASDASQQSSDDAAGQLQIIQENSNQDSTQGSNPDSSSAIPNPIQ